MIDRRTLISVGIAAPALLTLGAATSRDPFTLGIASGEPGPDGMVLWTRLAPDSLVPGGGMPPHDVAVRWEVAEDERFARIAARGTARASAAWGHAVHVEVAGLRPDRRYWYRFVADGVASPSGRTRTAPATGAAVERLRLVFASCQKYEVGRYAAWRHAVAEDPDLILFLGDYIYENAPTPDALRPHPTPEPVDLDGYRARYATYKRDPQLQAAHAAAPWVTTWDDHEVANDYADALDQDNGDPVAFLRRRAAAYRAYWEHMPLRRAARPEGPSARLYRTVDWGRLAQFQVIDDRQYRAGHPCQPPALAAEHARYRSLVRDCAERRDPRRTMLGAAQAAWLDDALGSSRARWNLLAQQTLMTPYARFDPDRPGTPPDLWSVDTWGGYPAARDRIVRRWRDAGTSNPLVLSGDIHAFAAADMADPDAPDRIVASEFVGGSITSLFHDATFKASTAANPGFRYAENEVRGYGVAEIGRDRADVRFRGLADARDPDSAIATLRTFAVASGRPGMTVV